MDRLDSMKTLLAAVEGGSLSAASRALGMPLPTVSRKISELEAHLRTQLIQRGSRRLSLTAAGRAYAAASRRILDDIEEAERAASGEYRAPTGDLTITAPLVFGRLHVEPVVLAFLAAYPAIRIRLVLADHTLNLLETHTDIAIRIGHLPDSSLVATRLGSICWLVCGCPGYFSTRGAPSSPGDLAGHDCIIFEGRYTSSTWIFGHGGKTMPVPIRARLSVNTAEAAIDAALAGAGVTRVLSYQADSARRAETLVPVLRNYEPPPLPVSLVYPPGPLLPLKLRAFLDFASPRLKASLAELLP